MSVHLFIFTAFALGYSVICFHSEKNVEFWDETEPFGQKSQQAADLRLPSYVVPSFYRLKLKADLENSSFTGQVSITLRANKQVKEIILHSKNLSISNNAKLTEQIYENVEMLRTKREVDTAAETSSNATDAGQNSTNINTDTPQNGANNDTVQNVANNDTVQNVTNNDAVQNDRNNESVPIDTQVTHSNTKGVKILTIMESTGDRLIIVLASAIKPNVDYILELSFSGQIGDSLIGFYKSMYKNKDKEDKYLGVTQFEATAARTAFPCFDEPGFKARFEISIAHRRDIGVLSNMNVSATELIPDEPDYQWTHFDRSVAMSTYLVAYVLSDFKSVETTYLSKDNATKAIKIWTRPEFVDKARYALNITAKLLAYYEDVFGVPYALDKIDLIAIPDFSSGAMENWGLITFRETTLLFDEESGVPRDRQNVAIDVAHELAHQWFGNLVTMRWWTDLWLNEGFATYIEYLGVDHIEPEWNMLESFSRDKMDLLRTDALKNTSPVSREVVDAAEISQKFNEISYTKGANLIRMLNHTLTEELFRKGLLIYLNDWKYANAEENDLWKAMSAATADQPALVDLSIVEFMNSWTRQTGYPLLQVNRNYATGAIELEQRLFTSSGQPYQNSVDQIWQIPVSYTAIDAPMDQWSTKPKAWLKTRISAIQGDVNETQALYVNVGAIGYYRVNYDQKNWQLLSSALRSGAVQSPITKAQLIDDAFNLAKSALLDYRQALQLTTALMPGETSKIVWDLLLNNMAFLRYNLRTTPGYTYFQDYMKLLLQKSLENVNFGLDKPKDDNEAFLIENLVSWECSLEGERCLQWADSQFEAWIKQEDTSNNPIPSYLRSLVYSTVLRRGGRRQFDYLWSMFRNATEPSLQSLLMNVLPSTRDDALLTQLLEDSLTSISKQYAVGAWAVEPGPGSHVAQRFLLDNFDRVYARFTAMDPFMFSAVLNSAFGFITDQYDLDRLKSFALQNKEKLLPMSQTLQKIVDSAALRIAWVKRHAPTINQWFRDYMTGKLGPDGSPALKPDPEVTMTAPGTGNNSTPLPSIPSIETITASPLK